MYNILGQGELQKIQDSEYKSWPRLRICVLGDYLSQWMHGQWHQEYSSIPVNFNCIFCMLSSLTLGNGF